MGRKPPSSRQTVHRPPTGDYDAEEATTLDPFSIHESELVVVPKGGTDALREDLRADPDVQDALRWLDPPSNAGPALAAPPQPPAAEGPPLRHPSSPPFAQVYTPLPQPHPGPGPYPTPVPSFVPNSGAYYLVTPMPGMAPAPAPAPPRSPILWIILTAVVTAGGIVLGWWLFAGRFQWGAATPATRAPAPRPSQQSSQPAKAPAPQPPAAPAPQHPTSAPAAQPSPAPAAQPATSGSVTAAVASLTPARSQKVLAPLSGEVSRIFLSAPGKVAKGDKLLEIRHTSSGGAKAKKLAARVAELETLAKSDPVYEEFLAEARKEQKAAGGGRSRTALVTASGSGHARLEVAKGDAVGGGQLVAVISTGGDWIVEATAKAQVQRSWTCRVELPDGKRAACAIDKVVATPSGSDITATVSPEEAPWLEDMAQKPKLILDPP